jgi:hypothetical protein
MANNYKKRNVEKKQRPKSSKKLLGRCFLIKKSSYKPLSDK